MVCFISFCCSNTSGTFSRSIFHNKYNFYGKKRIFKVEFSALGILVIMLNLQSFWCFKRCENLQKKRIFMKNKTFLIKSKFLVKKFLAFVVFDNYVNVAKFLLFYKM
jgi:hypothetical protein